MVSLQEQLLKADLVDKNKVKKVNQDKSNTVCESPFLSTSTSALGSRGAVSSSFATDWNTQPIAAGIKARSVGLVQPLGVIQPFLMTLESGHPYLPLFQAVDWRNNAPATTVKDVQIRKKFRLW